MRMTRFRDVVATVFVLCLVVILVAGIMAAMGRPVPILRNLFGR